MDAFLEEATLLLSVFASILNGGQLFKEKICSFWSKFLKEQLFSLMGRFLFGSFIFFMQGSKQEVTKVVSL